MTELKDLQYNRPNQNRHRLRTNSFAKRRRNIDYQRTRWLGKLKNRLMDRCQTKNPLSRLS
jgi:hypothetical protein